MFFPFKNTDLLHLGFLLPPGQSTKHPETNSSPLKMLVSNRNLQYSRGPKISGASCSLSCLMLTWLLSIECLEATRYIVCVCES